ncbi:MAG: PilZ domain-containing protein [Sphingomonadales bacterium]|nr:PilZ domain-containing protein [Sphingomonadales bacterium]
MQAAVDITSKVYWNARPDRRATPRTEVRLSSQVKSDRPDTAYVVLRDISTEGFSIRSFEYFAPGTPIWLDLKGVGVKQAEVIWEEAARTGCRFETPLTDAELQRVVANQVV